MKGLKMGFMRIICRFIASILWQLVWLIPLWGLCWYGKLFLPKLIRSQFAIDQLKDRLVSLEQFAEIMKKNTSFSNPTALIHYVSTQLAKISETVKLNTLEVTSDILQNLCVGVINLLWIVALIYAVIRVFKTFHAKTQEYALAHQVARQMQPDIWALQKEVMALRQEIQSLKKLSGQAVDTEVDEQVLLPNE